MHLEIFSYDTHNLIKESSKRSSVCKSRIGDWFTCTAFSNIFCTQFHVYVLSDRPGHPYVCSLAETFQKISDNPVITFSKSITIRKPQDTEPPERSWEAQRPWWIGAVESLMSNNCGVNLRLSKFPQFRNWPAASPSPLWGLYIKRLELQVIYGLIRLHLNVKQWWLFVEVKRASFVSPELKIFWCRSKVGRKESWRITDKSPSSTSVTKSD